MSRIGNQPIQIPQGATLEVSGGEVICRGPKGELRVRLPEHIGVKQEGAAVMVEAQTQDRRTRANHGAIRAELKNCLTGVTAGWSRTLELSGVGYRAALNGANLTMNIGFSHPVVVAPPAGVTFSVAEGKIIVSGADKHAVGQVAANIRAVKKPEPYKGKGIKYEGEHIRKKAGKAAKAIGGAPGGAK
jgi:large subunit ribosomal protein L6